MNRSKPYLLIAPLLLLLGIFAVGLLHGLLQSFGLFGAEGTTRFTLSYYREVFQNKELMSSLGLSLYIALTSAVISVVLGVLLSVAAVRSGLIHSRLFKILNIPVIVPHIVTALLIINLLSQSGLIARLFFQLGLISVPGDFPAILYDRYSIGVILTYLWKEIPFVVLMVATTMSHISSSLGETAANLGASPWQVFRRVTLPLCMPLIATAFLIVFAYAFGAYEMPYLLGATTPKALSVRSFVEYTHPDFANRPYAMVLNSLMTLISVGLTYLYYRFSFSKAKYGGGQHE